MLNPSRALILSLAALLVSPGAAALGVPAGDPLPLLPLPVPAPHAMAGSVLRVEGPDGQPFDVRLSSPVAFAAGGRAILALDPAAGRKIDPALLDVAALAKQGGLTPEGDARVIVRASLPLVAPELRVERAFPALGLASGLVRLSDLATLAARPGVERVFADRTAKTFDDESFSRIRAYDVHARADAQARPVLGTGVTIAILDTGVDYAHPDLGGCLGAGCKVVGGYDYVNEDADPMDDFGHGTHVADIAAGQDGVAPGASILAYKVLNEGGFGYYSDIVAAIQDATAAGADVISMSLGGSGTTDGPLAQAADWAVGQGVVVASAAGNSGCVSGCYGSIGEPAASLQGIAVGATTKGDEMAYFSSRGPVHDSNGVAVAVKPDVSAPGVDILAAVPTGDCYLCDPSGHRSLSGTSMATPHVSGVAALLLQEHPGWTPDDVKGALMGSAAQIRHADSRTQGAGRIDALSADTATLSILPGNGYLGLDLNGPGTWTASSPLVVKNLGSADVDVSLAAKLLAPSALTGPGTPDAPNPSGAHAIPVLVDGGVGAADPRDNVTAGGPMGLGSTYDITITNLSGDHFQSRPEAYLSTPDYGTTFGPRAAYPDPVHPGRYNVTFPGVPADVVGTWFVTTNVARIDFGVGLEDVVQGVAPATLHLAPGESGTTTLDVLVDNGRVQDGWSEGALVATTAGGSAIAKATFLKSGVIHLAFDPDTWFALGGRDGSITFFTYYPPERYDLLAPAGSYDFQSVMRGCPATVVSCSASAFTATFVDDVEHASESSASLVRPATAWLLDDRATFVDGTTVDRDAMPYCNWQPSATGCYNYGSRFFSHADNNGWFGVDNYGDDFYVQDTSWRVGRDFEYTRGNETYLLGDFREGIHEDWTLERDASTFDAMTFEYRAPAGTPVAQQIRYCQFTGTGYSFGLGNGRAPQSAREPFYWSANDPGRIAAGNDVISSMPCGETMDVAMIQHDPSMDCNWGGCRTYGRSDFFRHDEGGFHAIASPFDLTPAPRPAGDAVIMDGSSWLAARAYAGPGSIHIWPPSGTAWDYNHWFTPASGGAQFLGETYGSTIAWSLAVDGAQIAGGPLEQGYGSMPSAQWSDLGAVDLRVTKGLTFLDGQTGSAEYRASWNATRPHDAYLPDIQAVHVEDEGRFGSRFGTDGNLTLRFGVASDVALRDVRVDISGPVGFGASGLAPGDDGQYAMPLGALPAGDYDATVTVRTSDGAVVSLVQTPAFRVGESADEPPFVQIASPADGALVDGVVNVSGTAGDDAVVRSVEVRVGDGDWRPADGTTSWTYSFDASGYPEGNLTLEARASDGTQEARDRVVVTIQRERPNTLPIAKIASPVKGANVSGVVVVTGTASDADGNATIARVEVRVGEGDWTIADGTTSWSFAFDSRAFPDGPLTIEARAFDGGHGPTDDVKVNVANARACSRLDLKVASLAVERTPIQTSLATIPNDVAERRTVRAVVENAGDCAIANATVSATVRAQAWVPGTTTSIGSHEDLATWSVSLAAGQRVELVTTWDATGNVGDQELTVASGFADADASNDALTLRTWLLVGGLGGVAIAPIPTPGIELP